MTNVIILKVELLRFYDVSEMTSLATPLPWTNLVSSSFYTYTVIEIVGIQLYSSFLL